MCILDKWVIFPTYLSFSSNAKLDCVPAEQAWSPTKIKKHPPPFLFDEDSKQFFSNFSLH
jgi:hypothetical protein